MEEYREAVPPFEFCFGGQNKLLDGLNDAQKEAVTTTEGPVCVIAGPGTGKTTTLVSRVMYLVKEKKVDPKNIMVVTFTEKAAQELLTRISNKLYDLDPNSDIDIQEMYVGNFHQLCLRILNDYLDESNLEKNYSMLDESDEKIFYAKHKKEINDIFGNEKLTPPSVDGVATAISRLTEEMVYMDKSSIHSDSIDSQERSIKSLYDKVMEWRKDENILTFSMILSETLKIIRENSQVRETLQEQFRYIMVDEYQDTNRIQDVLISTLGEKHKNVCVVGDDDQSLYRFRGADVENILTFSERYQTENYQGCKCKTINLEINYRSKPDIIKYYNNWMEPDTRFWMNGENKKCRLDKTITPPPGLSSSDYSHVFKICNFKKLQTYKMEDWADNVVEAIKKIKDNSDPKTFDYNQIAILRNSVKNKTAITLIKKLEESGIPVYSPRSGQFFDRDEVRLVIAVFNTIFDKVWKFENKTDDKTFYKLKAAYDKLDSIINPEISYTVTQDFIDWINKKKKQYTNMHEGRVPETFLSIFYQMMQFKPFSDWLSVEPGNGETAGIKDNIPARNLSTLANMINRYETSWRITEFKSVSIKEDVENFFYKFLINKIIDGVDEYEDKTDYAPSGCVSVMTIHQSKGLEFPVVIFADWDHNTYDQTDEFNDIVEGIIEERAIKNKLEPKKMQSKFDLYRQVYTAYSRAKNLLLLTGPEYEFKHGNSPSEYFKNVQKLKDINLVPDNCIETDFDPIRPSSLKEIYSFTAHVLFYQKCPRQYKFYREYGFSQKQMSYFLMGTIVHETIEDIHQSLINESVIDKSMVEKWCNTNARTLFMKENQWLSDERVSTAAKYAWDYYIEKTNAGFDWKRLVEPECTIISQEKDFIMNGQIDLIQEDGSDKLQIVDFKTEKYPSDESDIARYKTQLNLYCYLVEKKMQREVSTMQLYFTAEEDKQKRILEIKKEPEEIKKAKCDFDKVVRKIENKEFNECTSDKTRCRSCDFRYYCRRK